MDDEDGMRRLRNGDDSPETSDPPADGDAAGVTVRAFLMLDLALPDYAAMLRQVETFRGMAHELRAILRGVHPYGDGDE